ncbi:hypothetical protein, partial [Embleya sp. NPDC055610]
MTWQGCNELSHIKGPDADETTVTGMLVADCPFRLSGDGERGSIATTIEPPAGHASRTGHPTRPDLN